MSAFGCIECDGRGCWRTTKDAPEWAELEPGWAGVIVVGGERYHLCPDCLEKALDAVGIRIKEGNGVQGS